MSYFSTKEAADKLGISYRSLKAIDYRPMFRNDKGYRWSGNDLRVIEQQFAKRLKRVRRAKNNYDKRKEVSDRIRQDNLPEQPKPGPPQKAYNQVEEYTTKQTTFIAYIDKWKAENKVKFPTIIQTITCYEEFNKS